MERRTRIKLVAFAPIAVFLASVAPASFASTASSNAAGIGTYQTFTLDKRITPKGLNSLDFDAGLDYGNTAVSALSRHDGYNPMLGLTLTILLQNSSTMHATFPRVASHHPSQRAEHTQTAQ